MVLSPLGSLKLSGFGEGILEELILRAGTENFPLQPNMEVRRGQEKARRKVREKRRPRSQDFLRVIIVCFEMGVPYFKVRRGARPRAESRGDPPT